VASEFPPQAVARGTHGLASSTHRRTDGICRKNHLPLRHAIQARNCAPPVPVDSRPGAPENGGGCWWAAEQSWARSKAGFGFGALHLYNVRQTRNNKTKSRLSARIGMTAPREIRTPRLLLRWWIAADRETFAALNADPLVMEYLPGVLDRTESDALVDRIDQHFEDHGFGLWAVEIPGTVPFAGFVGLSIPTFQAHFTPCVEVGWRLAVEHWGHGYATEAGHAAVICGFEHLNLAEVVSFTVPENSRSRRVMERIGMVHRTADDFDHPNASEPRRRHVLYRIKSNELPNIRLQPTAAGAILSRRG
jgi:RimJ/RimL family protein N-acetyltransferase